MEDSKGTAEVPKKRDWVKKRSKCTAALVFDKLRVKVRQDVDLRQGIFLEQGGRANDGFSFEDINSNNFHASAKHLMVRFRRHGAEIFITRSGADQYDVVTPILSERGKIRLRVVKPESDTKSTGGTDGAKPHEDLKLWQYRRRTLEAFFFPKEKDENY